MIVSAELLISSLNTEISHTLEKVAAETYDFNFDVKKALAACQKIMKNLWIEIYKGRIYAW